VWESKVDGFRHVIAEISMLYALKSELFDSCNQYKW